MRARRERGGTAADAIRYAFKSVGVAIIVNTVILMAGFLVLLTSSFKVNVDMGLLTALAIVFALILDFLFLPALLLLIDRVGTRKESEGVTDMTQTTALPRPVTGFAGLLLLAGLTLALIASPATATTDLTPVRGETESEQLGFEVAARADRSDRGFGDSEVELKMVLRNAAGREAAALAPRANVLREQVNRVIDDDAERDRRHRCDREADLADEERPGAKSRENG